MFNNCVVKCCGSRRKDVNFYSFLKNEIGLKKWLEIIDCDRLRDLSNLDLHKHFVCRKHFEKRFLTSSPLRSRLRVGAYPTLFTENEIISGIPQTTRIVINKKTSQHEHDYSRKRRHEDHTYCKYEVAKKCTKTGTERDEPISVYQLDTNCDLPSTSVFVPTENLNVPTETLIAKDSAIYTTPKSKRRKRVISMKKSLTPNGSRLYCEYRKSRKQLEFTHRACRAMKFSKENSFERITEKLNPLAKRIMWRQIKQCTKKSKGRRFSYEDKLIALSIMKQSKMLQIFKENFYIATVLRPPSDLCYLQDL